MEHNGRTICDLIVSHGLIILNSMKRNSLSCNRGSKSYKFHSSLGYLSFDRIKLLNLRTGTGIKYLCDVCSATKATCNTIKRKFQKPHRNIYELVHSGIFEMPIV